MKSRFSQKKTLAASCWKVWKEGDRKSNRAKKIPLLNFKATKLDRSEYLMNKFIQRPIEFYKRWTWNLKLARVYYRACRHSPEMEEKRPAQNLSNACAFLQPVAMLNSTDIAPRFRKTNSPYSYHIEFRETNKSFGYLTHLHHPCDFYIYTTIV